MAEAREPLKILAGWYTSVPRPHATEIEGITETKLDEERRLVIITIKIKRGHYILANTLRKLAEQQGIDPESIPSFDRFFNVKSSMQVL